MDQLQRAVADMGGEVAQSPGDLVCIDKAFSSMLHTVCTGRAVFQRQLLQSLQCRLIQPQPVCRHGRCLTDRVPIWS